MGIARSAFAASAVLAAFVATGTAGGSRARGRGVHVAAVVHAWDFASDGTTHHWPPELRFLPDGEVLADDVLRIAADGTTTPVAIPDDTYAGACPCSCVDGDANLWFIATQNGASRIVRVGPDADVTSTPFDPGFDAGAGERVDAIAVRDGRVHLLSRRRSSDYPFWAIWLQRFLLDGTPDSPAVHITPPDARLSDPPASIAVDAQGSAYVVWEAEPLYLAPAGEVTGERLVGGVPFLAVNWRRIDADEAVSSVVRLFTTVDGGAYLDLSRHLAENGTLWVMPPSANLGDRNFDAPGPIGIRRDGVLLPPIDLHAEHDRSTGAYGMAAFGVDAAGEVRTLLLPFGMVAPDAALVRDWRPKWRRFGADATRMRSRRLLEPRGPRRSIGPSGIQSERLEVAPDGSSLIAVIRQQDPDGPFASRPSVLEFVHLGPDGRVLAIAAAPPAFEMYLEPDYPQVASKMINGRPRFAVSWTQRTTAGGPYAAFLAILE